MLPYLPVIEGFVPSPNTSLPPPIYRLEPVEPVTNGALEKLSVSKSGNKSTTNGQIPAPLRAIDELNGHNDPGGWKPDDWIWAKLVENKRMTQDGWWQDVREIELEIDDPTL
jgi:hypothetical protein